MPPATLASPPTTVEQVGVIHLTSFNARALRDVSAALESLQQQGATELVLDLRDNRWVGVEEGAGPKGGTRVGLCDRLALLLHRAGRGTTRGLSATCSHAFCRT